MTNKSEPIKHQNMLKTGKNSLVFTQDRNDMMATVLAGGTKQGTAKGSTFGSKKNSVSKK